MALITPAQFKEHYPQLTGTAEDSVLTTLIARVDALFALYCGYPVPDAGARTMESATYTLYFDGASRTNGRTLQLGIRPIVSVTSIHSDPDWDYGVGDLVDSSDYVVDTMEGAVHLRPDSSEAWPSGHRSIKAVVVAGYSSTPADLVALVALAVRHLWDLRRTQGTSQYQVSGDQRTLTDADALIPAHVRSLLGPYVLWESRLG